MEKTGIKVTGNEEFSGGPEVEPWVDLQLRNPAMDRKRRASSEGQGGKIIFCVGHHAENKCQFYKPC